MSIFTQHYVHARFQKELWWQMLFFFSKCSVYNIEKVILFFSELLSYIIRLSRCNSAWPPALQCMQSCVTIKDAWQKWESGNKVTMAILLLEYVRTIISEVIGGAFLLYRYWEHEYMLVVYTIQAWKSSQVFHQFPDFPAFIALALTPIL